MMLEEFELENMRCLSNNYNVTFLFDKNGLIIATSTVDETAIVPTKKTYARRYELELLRSLDMYLEDLVELTIKKANMGGDTE